MDNQQERLRSVLLQLLDRFIGVCQEHDLRYYLAYGSVLGAVRHQGMIPWDDDIDIYMPRADYEKLQEVPGQKWGNDMTLTSWRWTKGYEYHFLKLEHLNTTIIEQFTPTYVGGAYLDIFPLDEVPANKDVFQDQLDRIDVLWKKYYTISVLQESNCSNLLGLIKFKWRQRAYLREGIQEQWEKVAALKWDNSVMFLDYHQSTANNIWHNRPIAQEVFGDGCLMKFEGRDCVVPKDYDAYLKHLYGDYMTPPPEHERKRHEFLYINLSKRLSDEELKPVLKMLKKQTAFKWHFKDEVDYWKEKLHIGRR